MKLTSSAFEHNQKMPHDYTCDGANINPPLSISDVPENAESLVLIMDDPDAPNGTFVHWLVANISPDIQNIEEKQEPKGVPGLNSNQMPGYYGPCPPDGEHRYVFKIYALDRQLDVKNGVIKEEVEEAMEGHIIEQAELIGLYKKQ